MVQVQLYYTCLVNLQEGSVLTRKVAKKQKLGQLGKRSSGWKLFHRSNQSISSMPHQG